MAIRNWASLPLLAAAASAQVPIDRPPMVPAAIPDSISVEADIPYSSYKETVLDILRPKAASKDKRPGMIVIHGGGWVGGTKEERVEYACLKYAARGFVVANVEYRLAGVAKAPAAVTDVLAAAQWFQKNAGKYHVDPKRIAVTGDSAGGHLALMVAMTPRQARLGAPVRVAAVVNFYGITDLADLLEGPHRQQYAVTWIPEGEGGREIAKRVSPISWVRKDLPPILTLHGDLDTTVPYEQGASLTRELQKAGASARLITASGQAHGFPKAILDQQFEHIFAFLKDKGVLYH